MRGNQTNNRAELLAAIVAINMAYYRKYGTVRVHTDSDLIFKTATQYLKKWSKNEYRTSSGRPIQNRGKLSF